jgi:hypothetical protein
MLFIGVLHPTQPTLRAVDESGFPSSQCFGATSRLMTNYLAAPTLHGGGSSSSI